MSLAAAVADAKAIIRRLSALKSERQLHESTWAECYDFTFPERGVGLSGNSSTSSTQQSKKNRILDGTAIDAARILAASIVSGTTPSNSLWFGLDVDGGSDESVDDDADRWLDRVSRSLFDNIHGSNFDAAAFEFATDLVVSGCPVLYIDELPEGGLHFEQWPIGQCYLSASKSGGLVDTLYREVEMTVEQVVSQYGLDQVSISLREKYAAEKYDEKILICHAIYPRAIHATGARMKRNLPVASCHVEVTGGHVLRESGYHEFPCVVPRWMLIPGTAYATGPVSSALGSIRTINDIKSMELAAMDVAIGGMWIAEDDGVLNPRSIKLGPRKIIIANSVDSMRELKTGANFNVAFSAEASLQSAIRKILLADQLQPQDGPAMTATEVHVRVQLIRQLLGPIYGRLQAEYLKPLIERCFGLAYRAGVFGRAPDSLMGKNFTIKYVSPLARAQKLEESTAIDQYVAGALSMAQANPEILDTIDFDEAQKVKGEALGVPAKVMRTTEAVADIRKARAQAAQAAQAAQMQKDMVSQAAPAVIDGVMKQAWA